MASIAINKPKRDLIVDKIIKPIKKFEINDSDDQSPIEKINLEIPKSKKLTPPKPRA